MTATQHFEDRLLIELRRVVAKRETSREPAHSHGGHRRQVLSAAGAALVIAVAAIVAIVVGTGDRTTSAYAIQLRPDGRVSVTLYRLDDARALQRSLRAAGVPAVVDFAAAKASPCVVASEMSSGREKGGSGGANETRHLLPSEFTTPSAGETSENAAIQIHPITAQRATSVTVSAFVVDPRRIRPHEELYIGHSGSSVLVREVTTVSCPTLPTSR